MILNKFNSHTIFTLFISFFKIFYLFIFLERGEEREKKMEKNTSVREKYQLIASSLPSTRDLAHSTGMCLDWNQTSNFQFAGLHPTHWATPVRAIYTFLIKKLKKKKSKIPWLVWLCGLSTSLQTKGLPVRFLVRAWVAGQVPSWECASSNHTLMFVSLFLPLFPSL